MPIVASDCFNSLTTSEKWEQLYLAIGGTSECFKEATVFEQQRLFLAALGSEECTYTTEDFWRAWAAFLGISCIENELDAQRQIYAYYYDEAGDDTLPDPECFQGLGPDGQILALFGATLDTGGEPEPVFDEDALAYFADIASEGGSITLKEKVAAQNYITRWKDAGAWSKAKIIWEKICADEVAALVYLKRPTSVPRSMTAVDFVEADYLPHGLKGDGSSKYLTSGFIPTDHGLDSDTQCYGVFLLGDPSDGLLNTGGSGQYIVLSTRDLYVGSTNGAAALSGQTVNGADYNGYNIASRDGADLKKWTLYAETTATAGGGGGQPDRQIELMRQEFFGAHYFAQTFGGWFASLPLTDAEARAIISSRNLLMAEVSQIERTTGWEAVVSYGNSITAYNIPVEDGYPTLLGVEMGITGLPRGISGSRATQVGRTQVLTRVASASPSYVAILYGVNDVYAFTSTPVTAAAYREAMDEIIERTLQTTGLPGLRVLVSITYASQTTTDDGTPNYQERLTAFAAELQAAATAYGVQYLDLIGLMSTYVAANGGDPSIIMLDGIHPNALGHELMAGWIAEAFE